MSQLKNIKIAKHLVPDVVPSTKQKVKLTPFRVGDEKILLMASESKEEKQMMSALKEVVRNCVSDIDADSLATFDLEYLFLKLRAISVGETSQIGIKCSECGKTNALPVDISTVKVEFDPNHEKTVKITEDLAVEMKYTTIDEISDFDLGSADGLMDLVTHSIAKVFYGDEIIEITENEIDDLRNILEELSSSQFEKIQNFFETSPKLAKDVSFVCGECGHNNELKLEGLANFF